MTETNIEHWTVLGMTCGGCAASLERTLAGTPGLVEVIADADANSVQLEVDTALFSPDLAKERIASAGFAVEDHG